MARSARRSCRSWRGSNSEGSHLILHHFFTIHFFRMYLYQQNDNLSFTIKRDCRQGDPLSPFVFVLCVEVLAYMIRSNKISKGSQLMAQNIEYRNMQMIPHCYQMVQALLLTKLLKY